MIYLYIKQHTITGLKYFGKTTSDPYTYLGSGSFWKAHYIEHGREHIQTIKVFEFDTQEKATEFALNFSKENNIVESLEWANRKLENGKDGRSSGHSHSAEAKIKISNSLKEQYSSGVRSKDRSGKLNPSFGKKRSTETKIKMSLKKKGKTWEEIFGKENAEYRKTKLKENAIKFGKSTKGHVSCVDLDGNYIRVSKTEFDTNDSLVGVKSNEAKRRRALRFQ